MKQTSIKILLFGLETGQSNELIKKFRSAGYVVRSQVVETEADLKRSLEQGADLFLGSAVADEAALNGITQALTKHSEQLPILLLGDIPDASTPTTLAANNTARFLYFPPEYPALIVQGAIQEYLALLTRRELALLQRKLAESEQRSELLFHRSESALAYVVDGILVSSNKAFARFFKAEQDSDLVATPIVDLFEDEDRNTLKKLLKVGSGTNEAELHPRDHGLPIPAQAADAVCDDEPCRQITLSVPASAISQADEDQEEGLPPSFNLDEEIDADIADEIDLDAFEVADAVNDDEVYLPELNGETPELNEDDIRFQALLSLKGAEGELYELCLENQAAIFADANQCDSSDFDHALIVAACKRLAARRKQDKNDQRLLLPVSRNALLDEDFGNWLSVALTAGRLPSKALILGISCRLIAQHPDQAGSFSRALQAAEISLAIFDVNEINVVVGDSDLFDLYQPQFICTPPDISSSAIRPLVQRANDNNCRVVLNGVDTMSDMANAFRFSPDYIKGHHIHEPGAEMDYDFSSVSA